LRGCCLDVSKAKKYGFEAKKDFDRGLKETIDWYIKNKRKSLRRQKII